MVNLIQTGIMYVSVGVLGLIALTVLMVWGQKNVRLFNFRVFGGLVGVEKYLAYGVFGVLTVGLIIYGAVKPSVDWDMGVSNNHSYATNAVPSGVIADYPDGAEFWDGTNAINRVLVMNWTKATYIPNFSMFNCYFIEKDTEGEMTLLFSVPVTNYTQMAVLDMEVTNYLFYCESSYTPDNPVRTNGVYHVDAINLTPEEEEWLNSRELVIPTGVKVKADGVDIVPPEGTPGEFIKEKMIPVLRGGSVEHEPTDD